MNQSKSEFERVSSEFLGSRSLRWRTSDLPISLSISQNISRRGKNEDVYSKWIYSIVDAMDGRRRYLIERFNQILFFSGSLLCVPTIYDDDGW